MGWWKELQEKHAPEDTDIEDALWATNYSWKEPDSSADRLMQQYLKYLEMADSVSDRRATANTFFLTLNTGVVSAIAAFGKASILGSPFLWFALVALITLCLAWMFLIRSYRTFNTA